MILGAAVAVELGMIFAAGLLVAFGAGYYLGYRAGKAEGSGSGEGSTEGNK